MKSNLFDKSLHYLGKNYNSVSAINIGAMDGVTFDEMIGYTKKYNFNVLYVEPIPYLFEELLNNVKTDVGSKFENSAICDFDGEVEMVYVDKIAIDNKLVIDYFVGMSAVRPANNGLESENNKNIIDNFGRFIKVPCLTLNSLFKKHDISMINIFKVDAEGFDFKIFKQLDLSKYNPEVIRIETFNMNEQEKEEIISILNSNNYIYEFQIMDLIAVREDIYHIMD